MRIVVLVVAPSMRDSAGKKNLLACGGGAVAPLGERWWPENRVSEKCGWVRSWRTFLHDIAVVVVVVVMQDFKCGLDYLQNFLLLRSGEVARRRDV